MELRWWSIEVLDGPHGTARAWRESLGNNLVEAAVTNGAYRWEWTVHQWGVLFEIAFHTDEAWSAYRALPVVTAALDAVPDTAHGLYVYPGRGGSGGRSEPRHTRPISTGGAAEMPRPEIRELLTLRDGRRPAFTLGIQHLV
ncbi:hypothetical protein Aab01nite_10380 [Paractinoplanes abujensis]|uniref:Uncharacterized protein n=1 Tax=Paractinoplanes abujensis TaxID=882441 RepID=A0A7W7CMB0_9ACTN|nr:hypothetical protein [Actinoplanes abujensis]MBB4691138.1 hypothetical protein [Actinoplanes abujensis]GID17448.1 hypothetical protein Aab01nite_10380 [Actinoplanes abujensis]